MNISTSAGRLHPMCVLVVAITIGGFMIAGGFAPSSASETPTTVTNGSLQFRVVDSAGQGVAGAKIHVWISTIEKEFKHKRDYKCDDRGQANVDVKPHGDIGRLSRVTNHA